MPTLTPTSPATATPTPASVLSSIEVSPDTATVAPNQFVQLRAILRDQNGNPLVGPQIAWTSDDSLVATVSRTGVVNGIGVACDSVAVTATSEGRSGQALITVAPPPGVYQGMTFLFDERLDPATVTATDFSVDGITPIAVLSASPDQIVFSVSEYTYQPPFTPTIAMVGSVADERGQLFLRLPAVRCFLPGG